ncbi:aminotransferase class I/II-fold pyridoxal phosphate-dependent enzyme [Leucobacter allii]|uniref:cysteine-S-conjugate beta-lyase n=1 Tax=Leucobacter allii TaxID=2932247 RepID=A0ABY4FHX3_9MICO|nr:aminotransferase class I/II-fold pyridoxal phosphate-dependent enzyme [Leucobacter allii]UOQ56254.1 aminotransferase class I/II-fold pyridoxal phosphate-dependent enzyme [Leucobacter allii]
MSTSLHTSDRAIGRAIAEMDFGRPEAVTRALADALAEGELGYLSAAHIARMQDAVGAWLETEYGWTPPPAAIRPVSDLVAGFRAVLTHFVPEGEPIIVPTPAYMPFVSVPQLIGRPVIEVPMIREAAGWRYDLDGLRAAFGRGARLLVLCNPHNPIGKVADGAELAELERLVDECGGMVFADEIHAPIMLGDEPHLVYAARSPRAAAHTITATSASKAFNIPGAKCGQLVFTNPEHLERWQRVGHWYEHQTSALGVVATEAAYGRGREWLAETLAVLREGIAVATSLLGEGELHGGPRVVPPRATYLLWCDLRGTALDPAGASAAALVRRRAGLIVTDGAECGAAGEGCVRFNAALPLPELRAAMERLLRAAAPTCD